ncbi:hypothetical protein V8F20_008825 [Naviculisporaceae sp. PSN 640]
MPYLARRTTLPELALTGGIDDPRARSQPSFNSRMVCRDLVEFITSTTKTSPLGQVKANGANGTNGANGQHNGKPQATAEIDEILSHSKGSQHGPGKNGLKLSYSDQSPVSDLVPGLITAGGLSRSPAFDALPVVSHWSDRTNESSAEDPTAAVCLTSTWSTVHVAGTGSTMHSSLGAPSWSLKSHGIEPVKAGSPKFSQTYDPKTDTLSTTVNLPRRQDTERTGGVISAATSISWMRNTRVADAVDCAVGLLSDASALLEARDKLLSNPDTTASRTPFAEVRRVNMPSWCTPHTRKPLPPKLSGVALSQDDATTAVLASEGCQGGLVNASIFSMAVGYNRGVYGGSISGLWAIMDSAFVVDYTVGTQDAALSNSLATCFSDVAAIADHLVPHSAGPHITDIRTVKGCNYACLRQKTLIEDKSAKSLSNQEIASTPIIVVWDDLARLARYKLADAVFCHVYYDAGGGEHMAAVAGLGCVVHDWIDLGADISCGEVSNIVPTLTRGSLDQDSLAEVYSRLTGVMVWYQENDPYNPAALALLFTHWWQLANCRHRPVSLLGRTDIPLESIAIAATVPDERPTLEFFRAQGEKPVRGQNALYSAENRLQALLKKTNPSPLPETLTVIEKLVQPVLAYIKGESDTLPAENEYLGAVLAAEIAYPHDQKILELWDLAIVMWECGALWGAGVAALCYTHKGMTNCDRARDDLDEETWN